MDGVINTALSAKLTTEIHLHRLIDVFHLNFGSILIKTDEHEKELTIVQSAAVRHREKRKQPTIQDFSARRASRSADFVEVSN